MTELVDSLTDVPKELERLHEELSLQKTVTRGRRMFEQNQLRSDKMVRESKALKECASEIERL